MSGEAGAALDTVLDTLRRAHQEAAQRLDAIHDYADRCLNELSRQLGRHRSAGELAADMTWFVEAAFEDAIEAIVGGIMAEATLIERSRGVPITLRRAWRADWLRDPGRFDEVDRALGLLGWDELAVAARGSANVIVKLEVADLSTYVRIPTAIVDDPAMFDDAKVGELIGEYVRGAATPLKVGRFTRGVYPILRGTPLGISHPDGTPLPGHVIEDDVRFQDALRRIPRTRVEEISTYHLAPHTAAEFHAWYAGQVRAARHRLGLAFGALYSDLHVPENPWQRGDGRSWRAPAPRELCVIHGDLNRMNRIVDGSVTRYLDFGLSAWGDQVLDVARNIYLTGHSPDQAAEYTALWADTVPSRYTDGWEEDLDEVLAKCRVVSSVIDPPRLARAWPTLAPAERTRWVGRLTTILNMNYVRWEPERIITEAEVAAAAERWATELIGGHAS